MAGGSRFELATAETPTQTWWSPRMCVEYGVCVLGAGWNAPLSSIGLVDLSPDQSAYAIGDRHGQ